MEQYQLKDSPIAYYINSKDHSEWILFLHAAFVDHRMFQKQYDAWKDTYNLLAVDIIGHGASIKTRKGDSIVDMALWIHQILAQENIAKIHIVGVSLGAVVAQDFANRYPQEVASLACFGGYDINHFDVRAQKENGAAQMRMMLKGMVSIKWFAKDNMKISAYSPRAQQEFYEMNTQFLKRSFRYLAGMNKMVNAYESQERKYPLLIGCGEFDIPLEQEMVKQWKNREPASQVVIFKDAGHCVNMDVPEEFHEVMENFWKGRS